MIGNHIHFDKEVGFVEVLERYFLALKYFAVICILAIENLNFTPK